MGSIHRLPPCKPQLAQLSQRTGTAATHLDASQLTTLDASGIVAAYEGARARTRRHARRRGPRCAPEPPPPHALPAQPRAARAPARRATTAWRDAGYQGAKPSEADFLRLIKGPQAADLLDRSDRTRVVLARVARLVIDAVPAGSPAAPPPQESAGLRFVPPRAAEGNGVDEISEVLSGLGIGQAPRAA